MRRAASVLRDPPGALGAGLTAGTQASGSSSSGSAASSSSSSSNSGSPASPSGSTGGGAATGGWGGAAASRGGAAGIGMPRFGGTGSGCAEPLAAALHVALDVLEDRAGTVGHRRGRRGGVWLI